MTETEERQVVIDEAKSWIPTPYHHMGRIKHGGTDCGLYILQCFENVGLISHTEIDYYPFDIAVNCSEPMYLNKIKEFCNKVDREPLPGDILVYKFPGSKVAHHASLVIDEEYIIHAYVKQGIILSNRKGYRKYEVGTYSFASWKL